MITYIKIHGFKSFDNFEMEFTPFTVIAGVNASGKSNLFDALKLLGRLAESDNLKKAFKEQRDEGFELFTQYAENDYADEMAFCVEMLVNKNIKDAWGNSATLKYTRLRYELKIKRIVSESGIDNLTVTHEFLGNLKHKEDKWVQVSINENANLEFWRPKVVTGKRGIPYIETVEENNIPTVLVPQDGAGGNKRRFPLNNSTKTVLSSFDTIDFPHVLAAKEEIKSWKFIELNPEDLRLPTNKNTGEDSLTQSGKNLAAVLYRIKQEDSYRLKEISRKLQTFIPNFIDVDVVNDVENKQYIIKLKDKDKKEYSSRVLSEGTLRILALCIVEQDATHTGLLCFEEPENGIHPFRIEAMVKLLKDLSCDFKDTQKPLRQVIVNTHSPVLVGLINRWQYDENVSMWYAEMKNRITDFKNNRVRLSVTGIIPVTKDYKLELTFSEQDRKISLAKVKDYLQTSSNPS
jgi:predicted ATPase